MYYTKANSLSSMYVTQSQFSLQQCTHESTYTRWPTNTWAGISCECNPIEKNKIWQFATLHLVQYKFYSHYVEFSESEKCVKYCNLLNNIKQRKSLNKTVFLFNGLRRWIRDRNFDFYISVSISISPKFQFFPMEILENRVIFFGKWPDI